MIFPTIDHLLVPVRSNANAQAITEGQLHKHALQCILMKLANWHLTISAAAAQLGHIRTPLAVAFGLVDCIPLSIIRESGLKLVKIKNLKLCPSKLSDSELSPASDTMIPAVSISNPLGGHYPDHAVAVVGMACKFPGADSLEEFWELLTSGTSMLQEMPIQRFSTKGLQRTPNDRLRYFGNFVRDIDVFDHRFFKKSSREAATMDPQQRILLEVAYAAMESSGYFGNLSTSIANNVGCFLGVCSSDYNDNIASHPPNAFSSLGSLRAFLSGKISHFFGWTGPSITYDTACSSSAVAIHSACRAIEAGECSQAVAGGVSLYTSPYFYQNLAAASFLSPTGATKPFDANADGYCRGEGVGLVVLKKLSAAVADGDNILGVIAGSAVNQNENSTYITVPHSPSQIDLYKKVSSLAGIDPKDVSFVEAHGTGTPVGDPIEFESIRKVFGGSRRTEPLYVTSVKGNIGHLEGASGVAALIKTLLMIQKRTIPVQASFNSLNPKISALEPDHIVIPTSNRNWDTNFQVACINNYGAAGSNAAMIVCQPPSTVSSSYDNSARLMPLSLPKYPIYISANSASSLEAYCVALQKECSRLALGGPPVSLVADIAFNLADKQNRSLPHTLITAVASLVELNDVLIEAASGSSRLVSQVEARPKPIVLAFGGQVNNAVGLNKGVYEGSAILRSHLDHCDTVLRSIGLSGLYPEIFQTNPVDDIVKLHSMLFSLQYSSAKAWIESGVQVDALVGHSFGQLTALCVSGSISLEDGLKLVCGRASLMQTHWGGERGAMISVEADINTILNLISSTNIPGSDHEVEIACYNGPTSHVLVGTQSSIDALQDVMARQEGFINPIKFCRLNVTHGFHSIFTEPILSGLKKVAEDLTFNEPSIPLETCSNDHNWGHPNASLIVEHTRTPVYFAQAVDRLVHRLGPCTWVEAGSSSSITGMVRRALGNSVATSHTFIPIQMNSVSAMKSLTDATLTLWKVGHKVQFWPFHRCQKSEYSPINLPSYQFEKSRHWLNWVENATVKAPAPVPVPKVEAEPSLLSFVKYRDQKQCEAEFRVDSRSEEYKCYVGGHAVLAEPLCPAPLYIELVSQAAMILQDEFGSSGYIPFIEDLEIKAPLGLDVNHIIALSLKKLDASNPIWEFEMASQVSNTSIGKTGKISHATGNVCLQLDTPKVRTDFARYERLVSYRRAIDLKNDPEAEAMQGSMIYKVFSKVVQYAEYYKGVRSIFSKDQEASGSVVLPRHDLKVLKKTITEPLAVDNFVQIAGLHVNSLNEVGDNEVFVCTKVDRVQLSPSFKTSESELGSWMVYSNFSTTGEREIVNDIFVFDTKSKSLVLLILGANFTKVLITSLARALSRANTAQGKPSRTEAIPDATQQSVKALQNMELALAGTKPFSPKKGKGRKPRVKKVAIVSDVGADVRQVLNKATDIPVKDIKDDSTFDDLGIDSLMITEVMSELKSVFQIDIPSTDLQNLTDIKSLSDYLFSRGCSGRNADSSPDSSSESASESESSISTHGEVDTSATSIVDEPVAQDNDLGRLAKLVAEHLETTVAMTQEINLADNGLDSLLCIELANDIKKIFDITPDMGKLDNDSTFSDLADMIFSQRKPIALDVAASAKKPKPIPPTTPKPAVVPRKPVPSQTASPTAVDHPAELRNVQAAFEDIRYDYDVYTKQTGFADFWKRVYPTQARLVLAYTVEAFASMGCSLGSLRAGERLPLVTFLPKHKLLMGQLYRILEDASLVYSDGADVLRTDRPIDRTPSLEIFQGIVRAFPQHASEHKLLHITGSKLAECLTGAADPLQLLFRRKEDKELLEEVYTNGPMYEAITKLLGSFLQKAYVDTDGKKIEILELGGGTGGTTKYIVDFLTRLGVSFTYTFTDLSGSLVAAAKKKFADRNNMEFMVMDIEESPAERFHDKYHTILSTNCIHATRNLTKSCANMRQMLRPNGFISLVEFTRNMYWFDLVFGLLDGWWLFEDGRTHVLATERFWESSMRNAGFKHVSWTDGGSEEARTLRIITAFPSEPQSDLLELRRPSRRRKSEVPIETVVWKQAENTTLFADIYYPSDMTLAQARKRPIGTRQKSTCFSAEEHC